MMWQLFLLWPENLLVVERKEQLQGCAHRVSAQVRPTARGAGQANLGHPSQFLR